MSLPPHLIYTCWASADEWQLGFVMLGANVHSIPAPPPSFEPIIGIDGFWGAHEWTVYPQPFRREFPYLPWIPLRPQSDSSTPNLLTLPVEKTMWRAHPRKSNCHVINPELFEELSNKWKSIKAALLDPFSTIISQASFSSIERPMKAYTRSFETLCRLEKDFGAWRDFVEVFRNLQRSLLELSAFLDWWKDVLAGDSFQTPIRAPTRGAIFRDEQLYADHTHWSVASYLLIPKPAFALDLAKEVALSPRELCSAQPMSLQPLVHSLHHWHYPPLVKDLVADLETAARGYHDRLDTFKPTNELKRSMDKMENRKNDEGMMLYFSLSRTNVSCTAGRRAKKAKMHTVAYPSPSNHPELRRLADVSAAPAWFPETQQVWMTAMGHIDHVKLHSPTPTRRFSLPPIHLFWGSNEENQRIFYYHFLLFRNAFQERCSRDLPPLTTNEWRSILGNAYWKTQWPKGDNPPTETFDANIFWKHGGPLFFGDTWSADVAAGRDKPTSFLPCRCNVQMTTADDENVRQVTLFYLNSFHVREEIKAMERLQFEDTFVRRWRHQEISVAHLVEMWDPSAGCTDFKFFNNKKLWRDWLRTLRDVVQDWDGFNGWNWGGFSNVKTLGINSLSLRDFQRLSVRLLAFYIHSFVSRLGIYPSPLLHPPILAVPSCHDHRRKFGCGVPIFVM
jgi:hypothetical protein